MRSLSPLAAVALAAVAAGCGTNAAPPTGRSQSSERIAVPWAVAAVRDHGRLLVLRYRAGGCLRGDGRAVAIESRDRVTITVREHEARPHSAGNTVGGCSQVLLLNRLHIRLRAPLDKRQIVGGPRLPNVARRAGVRLPS